MSVIVPSRPLALNSRTVLQFHIGAASSQSAETRPMPWGSASGQRRHSDAAGPLSRPAGRSRRSTSPSDPEDRLHRAHDPLSVACATTGNDAAERRRTVQTTPEVTPERLRPMRQDPQTTARPNDRPRRHRRREPLRRQRSGHPRRGSGEHPLLRPRRPPGHPRHADAGGDGHCLSHPRVVHGVRPLLARRLGRLHHRLAVLVLLGGRRGVRGGAGANCSCCGSRCTPVGLLPDPDDSAHHLEPRLHPLVRRDRVLAGFGQDRHDRRLPPHRHPLRPRSLARGRRCRSATSPSAASPPTGCQRSCTAS